MGFCPSCGQPLSQAGQKFCEHCGQSIGEATPREPPLNAAPQPIAQPSTPRVEGISKPKKSRKRLWIGVALVIFVLILAAAASVQRAPDEDATGGDAGTGETALIDKPADQLVISLADMDTGWLLNSEGNVTLEAAGFRDGYVRLIVNVESEFTLRTIDTTAATFLSIDDADAYFDERVKEERGRVSTAVRPFGDEAIYWEETGDFIVMLVRKSNVVWLIEMYREGTFLWDPGIDWVADKLLSKV
jgi:hypothetical protein